MIVDKFNKGRSQSIEERVDRVISKIVENPPDAVRDRVLNLSSKLHDSEDEITDITITKITKIVLNIYFMTGGFLEEDMIL